MLLAAIPLLGWLQLLSFPVLLVIVLVHGTASVVNGAAAMALVPRMVEPQFLQLAHARRRHRRRRQHRGSGSGRTARQRPRRSAGRGGERGDLWLLAITLSRIEQVEPEPAARALPEPCATHPAASRSTYRWPMRSWSATRSGPETCAPAPTVPSQRSSPTIRHRRSPRWTGSTASPPHGCCQGTRRLEPWRRAGGAKRNPGGRKQ